MFYVSLPAEYKNLKWINEQKKRSENGFTNTISEDTADAVKETQYIKAIFTAFAAAIVPFTHQLAKELGEIQLFGAECSGISDYIIWSLDHSLALENNKGINNISLAKPTAEMLNIAANQLIITGENKQPVEFSNFPYGGAFSALGPYDRLRAVELLEQLKVNPKCLPMPFYDNPGFVLSVINGLNRLAIFGYYSEWSGYGTTRTKDPDKRVLEYFPLGWKQVDYPGPSKGYHALRGYLVEKFSE